jgi:hypothetical protein
VFTVHRRKEYLSEDRAVTEFRRLPHLAAARRVGYEVAYRFFEGNALLDRPVAWKTIKDILVWDGARPIDVVCAGDRFTLSAQ